MVFWKKTVRLGNELFRACRFYKYILNCKLISIQILIYSSFPPHHHFILLVSLLFHLLQCLLFNLYVSMCPLLSCPSNIPFTECMLHYSDRECISWEDGGWGGAMEWEVWWGESHEINSKEQNRNCLEIKSEKNKIMYQ